MYRLLIVDDDAHCQDVLSDTLESEDYSLHKANDGQQALEMTERHQPSLILLDISMPGMDGMEVLRRLKANEKTQQIPVIMVTALDTEAQIAACLEYGAVDHVVKPFSNTVVRARVRAALRSYDAIQWQISRAMTDVLTDLPNRRAFDEELSRRFAYWSRQQVPFSLLILDVDHFKRFNDTHGHAAGDAVLRHLARTLKGAFREMDFVARIGGEEFAVILPSTTGNNAIAAACKVFEAVGGTELCYQGISLKVSVSAGLAEASQGESEQELFQLADAALYASKNAGRNCGHFHNMRSIEPIAPKSPDETEKQQTRERTCA